METIVVKIKSHDFDEEILKQAGSILRNGGLVAFPTETVYGIGANALAEESVKKVYEAKGRPSDNPLIVHISDATEVYRYAVEVNEKAKLLMGAFWPGPLTLIFKKRPIIPDTITGGLDTVAIRLPENIIARELIKASKVPIAAPSANISGKPSPTLAKHVIEDLYGKVDMIIDGGAANIGLESTVLDVTSQTPIILRPGGITHAMLEKIVGDVRIDPAIAQSKKNQQFIPRSPGMKYRHYAPKAKLTIIKGKELDVVNKINAMIKEKAELGFKSGVIASKQNQDKYLSNHVITLGDRDNSEEIAANLFKCLREFDEMQVDYIYSEAFSEENIGMAIMNRLNKAAGNQIIDLGK